MCEAFTKYKEVLDISKESRDVKLAEAVDTLLVLGAFHKVRWMPAGLAR